MGLFETGFQRKVAATFAVILLAIYGSLVHIDSQKKGPDCVCSKK